MLFLDAFEFHDYIRQATERRVEQWTVSVQTCLLQAIRYRLSALHQQHRRPVRQFVFRRSQIRESRRLKAVPGHRSQIRLQEQARHIIERIQVHHFPFLLP